MQDMDRSVITHPFIGIFSPKVSGRIQKRMLRLHFVSILCISKMTWLFAQLSLQYLILYGLLSVMHHKF